MAFTPEIPLDDYNFDWAAIFSSTPADLVNKARQIKALKDPHGVKRGDLRITHAVDRPGYPPSSIVLRGVPPAGFSGVLDMTMIVFNASASENQRQIRPVYNFQLQGFVLTESHRTAALATLTYKVLADFKDPPCMSQADVAFPYLATELEVALQTLRHEQEVAHGQA